MDRKRLHFFLVRVPLGVVALGTLCLCLVFILLAILDSGLAIAIFDLGEGRQFVVVEERGFQDPSPGDGRAIICSVKQEGHESVTWLIRHVDTDHDSKKTDYAILTADNGDVVALVDGRIPAYVYLLYDFSAQRGWQDTSCLRSSSDKTNAFVRAARALMVEHPDRTFSFAAEGDTWDRLILDREAEQPAERVLAPTRPGAVVTSPKAR